MAESVELQPECDFQLSQAGLSQRALTHTLQQINFISAVKLSARRKQREWQTLSPAPALSHSPVTGRAGGSMAAGLSLAS